MGQTYIAGATSKTHLLALEFLEEAAPGTASCGTPNCDTDNAGLYLGPCKQLAVHWPDVV